MCFWAGIAVLCGLIGNCGLLPLACEGCQMDPLSCHVRAIVSVAGGPAAVFEASVKLVSLAFCDLA